METVPLPLLPGEVSPSLFPALPSEVPERAPSP
jgi:hypothetical protein